MVSSRVRMRLGRKGTGIGPRSAWRQFAVTTLEAWIAKKQEVCFSHWNFRRHFCCKYLQECCFILGNSVAGLASNCATNNGQKIHSPDEVMQIDYARNRSADLLINVAKIGVLEQNKQVKSTTIFIRTGVLLLTVTLVGGATTEKYATEHLLRSSSSMDCSTEERSSRLIKNILKLYEEIKSSSLDIGNPNGINVTNHVRPVLHEGMNFKEAENILECAGFDVSRRPGPTSSGYRSDRFDVYAESNRLLPQSLFVRRTVIILLRPKSPKLYKELESFQAFVVVKYP